MRRLFIILIFTLIVFPLLAHPGGNMIVVGENVIWSYVDPVEDPQHHASIMIWKKGKEPTTWMNSVYPASDFMLYNNKEDIYIIERRYVQSKDHHEIRILKTQIGAEINEIWPWFEDENRIGENGFVMTSDTSIIYAAYPGIFQIFKGHEPNVCFEFSAPVRRIRGVEGNLMLLLSDDDCYLTDYQGNTQRSWKKLIRKNVKDPPLDRNMIFDMDYSNGDLLIAYWGNRSFELINGRGKKKKLIQKKAPYTPHWVAFWNDKKLCFASDLVFDGTNPQPHLLMLDERNKIEPIWINTE